MLVRLNDGEDIVIKSRGKHRRAYVISNRGNQVFCREFDFEEDKNLTFHIKCIIIKEKLKMKIQTLKEIKDALKDIPDDVLDCIGAGANADCGEEVTLLAFNTNTADKDLDGMFHNTFQKYQQLRDLNKWLIKVGEEAVKCHTQEDSSIFEREEAISSEDD